MAIATVGVIGGGTMGVGIAEVALRAQCPTIVVEVDTTAADAVPGRVGASLDRLVGRSAMEQSDADAAIERLVTSTDVESLGGCDLIIEAIFEDEEIKTDLFTRVDAVAAHHAIIASNTSSIPIVNLAAVTARPDRVAGMHFFNPAPVQPLVEIVRSIATSDETVATLRTFTTDTLGKSAIEAPDRAGFVVNRLLVPFLLAGVRMLDDGVATRDDIDTGMRGGCGHPMGPLELCDLIGLDVIASVADVLHDEYGTTECIAPPLLKRMVASGRLGRKSGSGFYDYES